MFFHEETVVEHEVSYWHIQRPHIGVDLAGEARTEPSCSESHGDFDLSGSVSQRSNF